MITPEEIEKEAKKDQSRGGFIRGANWAIVRMQTPTEDMQRQAAECFEGMRKPKSGQAREKEPKDLYHGRTIDEVIREFANQQIEFYTSPPSRKYYLDLASKAQYGSVAELLENCDKIERYLNK